MPRAPDSFHVRHDLAHACAAKADKVAVYPGAGVTGMEALEGSVELKILPTLRLR
jgi:hypothetical protein